MNFFFFCKFEIFFSGLPASYDVLAHVKRSNHAAAASETCVGRKTGSTDLKKKQNYLKIKKQKVKKKNITFLK